MKHRRRPDTAAWDAATAHLDPPLAIVDLDAFDANADDLTRRAGGVPIRVAAKSVRCRSLLERVLARPGWRGVMAYSLDEALWLNSHGIDDVFVAYPTVSRTAIRTLASSDRALPQITLAIDSRAHVDFLRSLTDAPLRVAVDVDASLRIRGVHIGVRRSPIRTPDEARDVAAYAVQSGLRVAGLMMYDAHIAGIPDSVKLRAMKVLALRQLRQRRGQIVAAVHSVTDLEFVNGGGTGSLELVGPGGVLTEVTAGSGLYGPGLFDNYSRFTPQIAAAYAIGVVRTPAPGFATGFSGGYHASGPGDKDRLPRLIDPDLHLVGTEGAGEVQTPVRGPRADALNLGDRIWLRHTKAGELAERFNTFHLVRGSELVEDVPTYRGEGQNFG